MARKHDHQETVRRYVLRQLSDAEQEAVELQLLTDEGFLEELDIVEDEVIDQYLGGELSEGERARFEEDFLAHPERQRKLAAAQALRRYLDNVAPEPVPTPDFEPGPGKFERFVKWFRQSLTPLTVAVAGLVLVVLGFGVWRGIFYQSDVDKGLIALNDAYRQERPVESRITSLNYAPFITTRGPQAKMVDETKRRLAELTLLSAKPTPAVHHALGKVYLAKNDFDRAIQELEEALKGDPNNAQIHADMGAAYLERGKLELAASKSDRTGPIAGNGLEDLGRSLEHLNKALELNPNLLEALFNRALCNQEMTLYEKAAEDWRAYLKADSTSQWAEEARQKLKLLEEQKTKTSQTQERLHQDFLAAYASNNVEAAWTAVSRSRARTGNAISEALLDDYLSLAANGRDPEAQEKLRLLSFAAAVELEKVGDRFTQDLSQVYVSSTPSKRSGLMQARGFMKSGISFYNKAEWEKAIALFLQAAALFAQTGDTGEKLFAEAWVGYCYLRIPDPNRAIEVFDDLSNAFQASNYKTLFAQALLAQADAFNGRNEFSKVLELANRSFAISEQLQDQVNMVRCLQIGTSIQLILGNYRDSLAAMFHALDITSALPPEPKLTWPLYHEAALDFYLLGMPAAALQFENEALSLANAGGLPLHASRSYDRLAFLYDGLHNPNEALKNAEQARREGLRISDERTRTNILAHSALTLAGLYRQSGEYQRAVDSYDEALSGYQRLQLDIYQYRAHKGKLLALMALNANAAAESELTSVLYWFEQNRTKIAEEAYRNKFFDTDQNTYEVAVDFQHSRKGDETKAFDYAEEYRARSLWDLMNTGSQVSGNSNNPEIKLSSTVAPLKLLQIQSRLSDQVQLLEYAVLDDKVVSWVVTRNSFRTAEAGITRVDLDQKVRRFLQALSGHGATENDEVINQAKALYANLIKPAEALLDPRLQICIIPDDSLNFLPFSALVSPSSNRYLVEDFALETAPSATTFIASSERASKMATSSSERLLIVGNPNFDRTQFVEADLPGATREAQQIAGIYGVAPLAGDEAVPSRVKILLPKSEVVHLATHAISDERSPLLSKLLLAKDGAKSQDNHHPSRSFIEASEIYGLRFPQTRLVVLSACQTGIERNYRGEGAIGLARPFIAGGVPLVVASLWPVESESTADLMISFHRHRKQDRVSTVEALRRAQLEFLHNQQPNSPKDFGWAAFVAIGGYAGF